MHGQGNYTTTNEQSYNFPADFLTQFPLQDDLQPPSPFQAPSYFPPSPLVIPTYNELDSMAALKSEFGNSTSSGCSSYDSPSSYASYNEARCPSAMQRSVSSHSLIQKRVNESFYQLISSPTAEFFDSESNSVRRVYSAGDLQGVNIGQHTHRGAESPLSNESSSSIIESMGKACRYSPEEKKEKIERYRSKRNQRNFSKKIKYECRKTLADSRPRIRGRFARNDELGQAPQNQWNNQVSAEEDYYDEDDDNWVNLLDSFSTNLIP